MSRYDYKCSRKEDALMWLSLTNQVQAEALPTFSATEFYKCGNNVYSIRYNKKEKTYEVKKRKLYQGRYLTFERSGICTAIKIIKDKEISSAISLKWLHIYQKHFDIIVKELMVNGLLYEEAKDYAQEAFLKINNIEANSDNAFCCIWFKRSIYDWLNDRSLKSAKNRMDDVNIINARSEPREFEINISTLLNNSRQAEIINMMLQGYSITDIAELTHQTWDAVFSVKQRAFKKLKQKLSIDHENK